MSWLSSSIGRLRSLWPLAVSTVPAVHEDVQQRAGENQQERQKAERMGPVLGKKKESADQQKPDDCKAALDLQKPRGFECSSCREVCLPAVGAGGRCLECSFVAMDFVSIKVVWLFV